jgi:hypothetical protein
MRVLIVARPGKKPVPEGQRVDICRRFNYIISLDLERGDV